MQGGSGGAEAERCNATHHNDTANSSPHTSTTVKDVSRCEKSLMLAETPAAPTTNTTSSNDGCGTSAAVATATKTVPSEMPVSLLETHERRNWLIHQLYVRQEYAECISIIEAQLQESGGLCEYALYVKGMLMRRNGELTESLLLFQAAMHINPQNSANRKQVAESLLLLGQHRAAIEGFREAEHLRAMNGEGEDWRIQCSIGTCYMYMQEYHRAEDAFAKSISIRPHDFTVMQLGKALVLQKSYKRAIHIYTEALQTSPENPDLLTTLGLLYLQVGDPAKAFRYLGKCLTLDASNTRAIMAVASIMQENSEFGVALNKYRVAIAKLPSSARLWSNIGMCFLGKKNMHAAVSCLQRAVSLAPFEWRIVYNMGLVFLHAKQYASAYLYLSASTQLHGQYAPALMHLGVCLSMMNDVENACAAYDRALSIAPEPLTRLNYCITLLNFGQEEEAKRQFEVFMQSWEHARESLQKERGSIIPRTVEMLASLLFLQQTHSLPADNILDDGNSNDKNVLDGEDGGDPVAAAAAAAAAAEVHKIENDDDV